MNQADNDKWKIEGPMGDYYGEPVSANLKKVTKYLDFTIVVGIRSDLSFYYQLWRTVADLGTLANADLRYPGHWHNTKENIEAATEYCEFETLAEAMAYAEQWMDVPWHLFPRPVEEPFCNPPSGDWTPWYELAEAAIDQAGIEAVEKKVLLYLVGLTLNEQGICSPTLREICERLYLSKKEVEAAIRALCHEDFIEHQNSGFRRYYRVIDPRLLAILNGEVTGEIPEPVES
jgi:hypothetical protein